jgi:hypothetical protein
MLQDAGGAWRRVDSESIIPAKSRLGSVGLLSLVTGALK